MIRRRKGSSRWWKVALVVTLTALLLAEGTLQILFAGGEGVGRPAGGGTYYVPYVGYQTTPRALTTGGWAAELGWPEPRGDEGPLLWALGGSTMQGGYASVPGLVCEPEKPCAVASWLARSLAERGQPHRVWNLGQRGYRSHTERILFVELLARLERPAIAVFYDGVNDAWNHSGVAGYPFQYEMFRDEIEWLRTPNRLGEGLRRAPVKLAFLAHYFANSHTPQAPRRPFGSLSTEDFSEASVADEALSYLHNVDVLSGICAHFGVRCLFVWQPLLCDKNVLSAEEQEIHAAACGDERFLAVHREVSRRIADDPRVLDLRDLFRETPERIFLDELSHIDEASSGNRRVAEAIVERLLAGTPVE